MTFLTSMYTVARTRTFFPYELFVPGAKLQFIDGINLNHTHVCVCVVRYYLYLHILHLLFLFLK